MRGRFLCVMAVFAAVAASAWEQTARMPVAHVAIPGVREFSGRLIARPLQVADAVARGMTEEQAAANQAAAQAALANYPVETYVWQTDEYILSVPVGRTEDEVSADLMDSGAFQYVEPDWTVFPLSCPNDSNFSRQWHHKSTRMQSCDAWDIEVGDPSVSVGICDTGVRTTHSDLLLNRLEGYNAVDEKWESLGGAINDIHGHGTETTGCAAANGNNANGVSGVGWNLSHRMLRVSNSSSGSSSLSVLQHAARTAIENGDRVASVSYSGVDSSSNLTTATYVRSIGGLMVWAAGNESRQLTLSNRDADDIIVVGATTRFDRKASFSNFGMMVDLVAPGAGVYTTANGNDNAYASASGTSFSCPLTAGLAALVWSADPALSSEDVEAILKAGAEDLGAAGVDDTFGYGRINSLLSLQAIP